MTATTTSQNSSTHAHADRSEPRKEPVHDLRVVLAVQPLVIKHGHTAQDR